jgi:hypothetical protein
MFQTKVVGKIKTYFIFNNFVFRNHAVNDVMWENTVAPNEQQMAVWHMYVECWIPQDMNIHSEHIILIALPLQNRLHEHTLLLGYTYISCFFHILFCLWALEPPSINLYLTLAKGLFKYLRLQAVGG